MYLFKCKCGCLFTLKQLSSKYPSCPDCRMTYNITSYSEQNEIDSALASSGASFRLIPDDAKITVSYDA